MKIRRMALLCVFLLLAGCAGKDAGPPVTEAPPMPSMTTVPTQPPPAEIITPETTVPVREPDPTSLPIPAEPAPVQPVPVQTQPAAAEPQIPEFYDLNSFRYYLYDCLDAGQLDLTFRYTGIPGQMDAQTIARLGNLLYVSGQLEGDLYTMRLHLYPGVRMVSAHRSGELDTLSPDERQALDIALTMVEQARQTGAQGIALELALFDMLRDRVSYNTGSTHIQDPDQPPRYLTAVGALVDGSANCQGYADGFYVLASLAGFLVDKMHVDIPSGGHVINVVLLDGNWYIVDATFNDYDDPTGIQVSYRLFNAGLDQCHEYTCQDLYDRHFVSRQTGPSYYYNAGLDGLQNSFTDLQSMAEDILDQWQNRGISSRYVMLQSGQASWAELSDVLAILANQRGIHISYHIWTESNWRDTFFHITID